MSQALNFNQESVIKSLIRLTNKKLHHFADDGLTEFVGHGYEFYFTDTLIAQTLSIRYETTLAALDDLEDLKIVRRSTDGNGRAVFCLADIEKRLAKFEAKQAALHG